MKTEGKRGDELFCCLFDRLCSCALGQQTLLLNFLILRSAKVRNQLAGKRDELSFQTRKTVAFKTLSRASTVKTCAAAAAALDVQL